MTVDSRIQPSGGVLSRLGSTDDVDAAIADVDGEIERLLERRSLLRTCRNTFAPVFGFPAEIFSRIFETCVGECADAASRAILLITLTHVCRYWRYAALQDPKLWEHADFTHPEIGYTMLTRAANHPVSLTFPFSADRRRQLQALDSLLGRKEHILSLDITAFFRELETEFRSILCGPAPLLERLRLCNADPTGTALQLTPADFPSSGQHLRELELSGFTPPPSLSIFSGLTRLSIRNLRCCTYSPVISFVDVLSLLMQLPELIDFELQQKKVTDRTFRQAPLTPLERPVELPVLKRIRLDDTTNMIPIGLFLLSLSSPSLDLLDIRSKEENPVSLHQTGEWLRGWIQASNQQSLAAMSLALNNKNFKVLLTRSGHDSDQGSQGCFEMSLERETWLAAVEHFFFGLVHCELIPANLMRGLTTLELTATGLDDVTPQSSLIKWSDFASLPALTSISLDEIPCWTFLNFVQTALKASPFPALRSLMLRNVIMWQEIRDWDSPSTTLHAIIRSLVSWLRYRRDHGMQIQHLMLKDCYCLYDPHAELQPLVANFMMEPEAF
ncbi:hypothetical protein EIP86_001373 [Pleurotus ostreatoroseus]|nr:hypothetical protein EIP86_001373 [Pleurotus ostreatoroseus]